MWTAARECCRAPPVLAALTTMLGDRDRWCMVPNQFRRNVLARAPAHPDALALPEELPASPADAAIATLWDYPVYELLPALRTIEASDGIDAEAAGSALRRHQLDLDHRVGPRVTRLDDMVASCSPDGFERMFAFVGAGLPWNDGRPTQAEAAEVRDHVTGAVFWLALIIRQPLSDRRDCVVEIRQAMEYGSLGQSIVDHFDGFDQFSRTARDELVELIGIVRRPSAHARLEQVAAHDPDSYVRGTAEKLLEKLRKQR
jgi:hypothetical protein